MRYLFIFMIFFVQLFIWKPSLRADNGCEKRYFVLCYPNNLRFDISALIWRTCRNDYIYALTAVDIPADNSSETDLYSILQPSFHGGVRASVSYDDECQFFTVEYTYFHSSDKDTSKNPTITPFFSNPTNPTVVSEITATVKNQYQRVRALGAMYLMNRCCFDFYVFGGLGWLYLKENDELNGPAIVDGVNQFMKEQMRYNSGTVELGIGGEYCFCGSFGLSGQFNGVAALGQREYDFKFLNTTPQDNRQIIMNRLDDVTLCVPGIDVRLELFYTSYCFCFPLSLALGYEHHHFFNALLGNPLFVPAGEASSQTLQTFDAGFGGPYVSFKFNY